jgi:TPR repeat protein
MTAYSHFKQSQSLKYGPAENLFRVRINYLKNNDIDYEKLMTMFTLVCKQEIGSLEYNLGRHYRSDVIFAYKEEMLTCLKDIDSAIKWFEIAANKGIARAQNELGALLEAEKESKDSIQKSIYWYEKACENGNLDAAFTLACFYLEGKNVVQDLEKAFYLLYEISNLGHLQAKGILYLRETPYLKDNYNTVIRMLEGAAKSGNIIIQYRLGMLKLNGGSSNEVQGAVRYLSTTSKGGYIDAAYRLGVLFDEGTKVEQDYIKSINYYQIAANKGNENALFRLAQFYHFGRGCIQDYTKAYQLYIDAAQEGNLSAQMAIKVAERSTWNVKQTTPFDLPDDSLFNHKSCLFMWEYLAEHGNVDLQYKLGTL